MVFPTLTTTIATNITIITTTTTTTTTSTTCTEGLMEVETTLLLDEWTGIGCHILQERVKSAQQVD